MAELLSTHDYSTIPGMKKLLRREVTGLCQTEDAKWKLPIKETLSRLHELNISGVLFGGTLRSLLLSKIKNHRRGRPRDIDIVIEGTTAEALEKNFSDCIERKTRFGGLKLKNAEWQFDIWPIENTWAILNYNYEALFEKLPSTTFFNLEAVAIDVWTEPGRPRKIYSGNDQFFQGIIDKVLDINLEDNPFPDLCVVRALVLAADIDFNLSVKLAQYIIKHGIDISPSAFEKIQFKHYGIVRVSGETIQEWVRSIEKYIETSSMLKPIPLPKSEQLIHFEKEFKSTKIHIRTMPSTSKTNSPSISRRAV